MVESLLGIMFEGLKAWNTEQGTKLYKQAMAAKEEYDKQMDRKARTGKYSQLAIDRSLRDLDNIATTYLQYLRGSSKA
jgi:hypothetical protein